MTAQSEMKNENLREMAMGCVQALQRLNCIVSRIDESLCMEAVPEEDKEKTVFVRNSLCITANIWNDSISGNVHKLYRGFDRKLLHLSLEQKSFYQERMPRAIESAKRELGLLHLRNTEYFSDMAGEIISSLVSYAVNSTEIAEYLFTHEENLDDIPMLDMIDMGTNQTVNSTNLKECA